MSSKQPSRIRSIPGDSSKASSDNLVDILTPTGQVQEIRHQEGHILVCQGCCCGNTEKGFPPVPLEAWKSVWKARAIRRRVHLTIAGCLGPCPLANVVLVIYRGACIWLQAIDSPLQVRQVYDYVESMMSAGRYVPLPSNLEKFHFTRYDFDTGSCSATQAEYSAPGAK
jgi:cobaltochelatase CobN